MLKQTIISITTAQSALPTFKVWDEADGQAVGAAVDDARILFNNLIIVHCGESINTAIGAVSGGGTIYIEGNCVYTEDVVVDKAITFRTIYDGLPLPKYPPVIQGINHPMTFSNGAAGSACGTTFATGAANTDTVYFWSPSTITTAFPTIYTTNDGAALATGQFFTGGFKGMRRPTQLRVIYGMGDGGCIQDAVDLIYNNCELNIGAAGTQVPGTSGIVHIEGGTYVQDVIVGKSLTFNNSSVGTPVLSAGRSITLNNAAANSSATDCQTIVASTATGTGFQFRAPIVFVNADQTDVPTITTDSNTVNMGILLVTPSGSVRLADAGTFTANRPTINKTDVTLRTVTGGTKRTVDAIYLNGSGACGGPESDIVDILVDTVFMANNADCIQTALGNTDGFQDDEGVGNAVSGGNRQGTVAFTYGGATSVAQALTVDKDVRFSGNVTPNTNSGSLTMRLGAQGTQIAGSTNFCNTTVNVTQRTGSSFTQIPDIQDGITLACASGTVNVGDGAAVGSPSTWGGAGNTYNNDNTIDKSLTVQGLNTTNACANNTAYVIDGSANATNWIANAARSAFTSTFSGFTTTNPVFTIASGVNSVTIRGFDFTSLTQSTANAVIYAAGTGASVNNSITISGNVYTNSSEIFLKSAGSGIAATYHTGWNIDCNRMVPNASITPSFIIELIDHNGITINRNLYDGTGSSNSTYPMVFRGFGGAGPNNITNNSFTSMPTPAGAIISLVGLGSSNQIGNVSVLRNRIGNSAGDGIELPNPESIVAPVTIANNFINTNAFNGIFLNASTPILHQHLSINNNSITGNLIGLRYTQNGATGCGVNARGNWWNNASGPTNTYNPLNVTPGTATAFGDPVSNNGTFGTDPTRISYIPWWTIGTDAGAGTDGWQEPAATNALGRVTRTNNAGAFQASFTTINGAAATATANDRIIIMQGMPHWTPAPGPTGSSAWGAYFSEYVTGLTNVTGVEFRGVNNSEYNCTASAVQTSITYIAGTENTTHPVPSNIGAAVAPSTGTVTGSTGTGNAFEISGAGRANTIIRNLRIQGYSDPTPSTNPPSGAAIMATQTSGLVVDGVWVEGGLTTAGANGSWGVALDRTTTSSITSSRFGTNRDLASTAGGLGGVSILAADAANSNTAIGPNTIGQNAVFSAVSTGLGFTNGNNTILNNERAGVQIGGGGATSYTAGLDAGAGASTLIQFNTIQGSRDIQGTGGAVSLAAIYLDTDGGTVQVNNNTIGSKSENFDNNVDIYLGTQTFTFSGSNNTIRDSSDVSGTTGTIDGESWSVTDELGTRGAVLRTFFNPLSGNTFSHAAILTTDGIAPYNFATQMNRNQPVEVVGTPTRIYRSIAVPLGATTTTYGAGSETYRNIVEVRENAGWTATERDQYYSENLSFVSITGRVHQTILGPAVANPTLSTTSAHLISTAGTGTALTANGQENKYIRGGVVMHAIGNGLYGSINTGAANKGDVYLQLNTVGTDAGTVQFAYHATTFGSQALVTGTGTETGGTANANANKPSIIKAGLDDANDDTYTAATNNQNRRTGVFQSGTATTFTKPTEPVAGLGVDGMTAFPNPSNGGIVNVQFSVPVDAMVRVALYDALGRKVTDLKEGTLSVGVYNTEFDVNNLPSGTYTVRMEYDYSVKTVQVHVIK
jgi:hypothetical protein